MSRVIWLTGASSGIGRALALEMATRSYRLGLTARRKEVLAEVADDVREQGGEALVLAGDVTDQATSKESVARLVHDWGRLDVVVANAGTGRTGYFHRLEERHFELMVDLNLKAVMYNFHAALPQMLEQGAGHLVAVSSLAGYRGLPRSATYSATKTAVNTFCEALQVELKPRGIHVTSVCPGFVKTELTEDNKFEMPFILEARDAARRILKAIDRKKIIYPFPWPISWGSRFLGIIPGWLYRLLVARAVPGGTANKRE